MKQIAIKSALMHMVTFILFTLCFVSASAQYYMNVVQKDGEKAQYLVSNIDSVYFSEQECPATNYSYVDLGLSVMWATFNVGATKPEEYGDYFAWGEIETKTDYSWSTYKWCSGSSSTFTKYCNNSNHGNDGFTDILNIIALEDDVAHVKWGGSWRMPTLAEQNELRDNCTWTCFSSGNAEFGGVAGYKVTSNKDGYTDRFIFLPAAGVCLDTTFYNVGSIGYYWSSLLFTDSSIFAYTFNINSDADDDVGWGGIDRAYGISVRPVCPSEEWLSSANISFVENEKTLLVGGNAGMSVVVKQNGEVVNNPPITWSSDNPAVAVVYENGVVIAMSSGIAHIKASIQNISAQCTVTVSDNESEVEHEYVDLGLSVKWATCNVGAIMPQDYGYYYAWGETETKSSYNWSTYKWCNGSNNTLTKYCNKSNYGNDGFTDTLTVLTPEDDVAHEKWGGTWRMPTMDEQDELCNNCTWTWYSSGNREFDGVAGYKVTSNIEGYTDRFIFLPAGGYRYDDTRLIDVGGGGYYWSSSHHAGNPDFALHHIFHSFGVGRSGSSRSHGLSVRPVCP